LSGKVSIFQHNKITFWNKIFKKTFEISTYFLTHTQCPYVLPPLKDEQEGLSLPNDWCWQWKRW